MRFYLWETVNKGVGSLYGTLILLSIVCSKSMAIIRFNKNLLISMILNHFCNFRLKLTYHNHIPVCIARTDKSIL